ncbi:MAG: helix-turn-helix transcriptional regulator [Pseudomonadales bacterium]
MRHFEPIETSDVIVRSNGVSFSHGHIYPRKNLPDWHQLVYAQRGAITVKTDVGGWLVPPQRAVLVPAGVATEIHLHGRVTMSCLYFRLNSYHDIEKVEVVNVSPVLCELVLHIVSLGLLRKSIDSERHLAMVVIDLLQSFAKEPLELLIPMDHRARKVFSLLEEQPDLSASLHQVATMAGTSRRTMERVFQREMDISFGRWRQQVRMMIALRLLAEGESVTSVALNIGYSTASSFIYAFRQVFGQSPGEFFR